jgi:Tol biopolymer transport system component
VRLDGSELGVSDDILVRCLRRLSPAFGSVALLLCLAVPASAAFPGHDGRILYGEISSRGRGSPALGTARRDGSARRTLTWTQKLEVGYGQWSPNGRWVLFDCRLEGTYSSQVCVARTNGSGATQLTRLPGANGGAAWSPDGTRIVFTHLTQKKGRGLRIIRRDGSHLRHLTEGFGTDASWSTRNRIAFASRYHNTVGISVIRPDGTRKRRLTTPRRRTTDESPDWSPDGRWLVFSRQQGLVQIYTMTATGKHLRRLTNELDNRHPAWSPSGRFIAYEHGGNLKITIMRANGSHKRVVVRSRRKEFLYPSWQPIPRPARSPQRHNQRSPAVWLARARSHFDCGNPATSARITSRRDAQTAREKDPDTRDTAWWGVLGLNQ